MQDLPRPAAEEHANNLRHVAFYMYGRRSLDSKSFTLQSLRARSPSFPADGSAVLLLRRLPNPRKPELDI
jgi:hypothetical protein